MTRETIPDRPTQPAAAVPLRRAETKRWRCGLSATGLFCVFTAAGCCWLRGHTVPEGIETWQDPTRPTLSLHAKADLHQSRLEAFFQTPEGLLRYSRRLNAPDDGSYGDLSDGCFHTGIYLASQALRYAVTKDPAAREQVLISLGALRLLMDVTGKRGLLARHVSPSRTSERFPRPKWRPSATRPEYIWRSDVSKDQYAGFIHGLGVALAVVDDADVRARVRDLAVAAADHLIENDLRIIDVTGHRTTYGDLSGSFLCVPLGVNSLIALAIAKVAAVSSGEKRYVEFYRSLVDDGFPENAYWFHIESFDSGRRVNEHMGYLALYPLLLLEEDLPILAALHAAESRTWRTVRVEHNAFFSFIHATGVEGSRDDAEGLSRGREALFEFPESKVEWPVDLTREGFEFPRAVFNTGKCEPRSTVGIPLYLRPRGSSTWVSNPYRLVGSLNQRGDSESAPGDYLVAYWMARYHRFVGPEE